MIALSERGRVAVTEVLGRGAARAAAALGRRIGLDVTLTVPTVDVLFARVAADVLEPATPGGVLAVVQHFEGAIEGTAAIVVAPESNAALATLAPADRNGVIDVGRTVLTACLGSLASVVGGRIVTSPSEVFTAAPCDLMATMAPCPSSEAMVLFLNVEFAAARIQGAVTLVMAIRSAERFAEQLDALAPAA